MEQMAKPAFVSLELAAIPPFADGTSGVGRLPRFERQFVGTGQYVYCCIFHNSLTLLVDKLLAKPLKHRVGPAKPGLARVYALLRRLVGVDHIVFFQKYAVAIKPV